MYNSKIKYININYHYNYNIIIDFKNIDTQMNSKNMLKKLIIVI